MSPDVETDTAEWPSYDTWEKWKDTRGFRSAFVAMLVAVGYEKDEAGAICFMWCYKNK
ncbi:MAG: hypothetical protein OXH00_02925 [Candidatus Poribacteria bacterium]|nr:hypothetical protein [Candidatus Poribacteria bacterium]